VKLCTCSVTNIYAFSIINSNTKLNLY
jgi:hypothetical protein